MITPVAIGHKIAEARKKMNISQAQVAQRLFISSQAVGKWERGESMPDIVTFNRLAEMLGVDLNYFSESFPSTVAGLPPEALKKKPGWDMSCASWVDADFSGLKNLHEKFSSSNMQHCLFIRSEMSGLLLEHNNVDSCDFSGSDISNSRIQRSNLVHNLFKDCSLKETEFAESHIKGCDFSGADFSGAVLRSCTFARNTIANTIWNRTSFNALQINDIVFDGPLEGCDFVNCVFIRVTFQNATLTNTFFKNKSLKRIRFLDCRADRMTYEFLKNGKADLSGIKLGIP